MNGGWYRIGMDEKVGAWNDHPHVPGLGTVKWETETRDEN